MSVDRREYLMEYHKNNYKRVPLDLSWDKYYEVKKHADSRSESVNGFIKRAIDEAMERDNNA